MPDPPGGQCPQVSAAPILTPAPDGPAERLAGRMQGRHPALVFLAALLLGFAVVAVVSIAVGALVTDVIVKSNGIGSADESFVRDLVDQRTGTLTDISSVGSTVGSVVLVVIAVLVALWFCHKRQWRMAAFAAFLPPVESGLYRLTSLADPRQRPDVPRLDDLPVDASYPSGHAGASVAVYVGLVLLLASQIVNPAVRALVWILAIAIPVFVAMSRIYRGMHHPIDVAAGFLIGIATIAIVAFACRAAGAADLNRKIYWDTEPNR